MKLSEILLDANLLVPNALNDEIKVRWLNQDQRQLYRDFGFPDVSHDFLTEPGVNLYFLPDDCSRERITSVIVNDMDYQYVTVDDELKERCWSIIEEKLWIYPIPSVEQQAYFNYRPRPSDMRIDMQDEEPTFPEDFHELLVLGIGIRIARSTQNVNKSMELQADFDRLLLNAKRSLRPSRAKKVRVTKSWR